MKKNNRTKLLAVFLVCTALLTSCGSEKSSTGLVATDSAAPFRGFSSNTQNEAAYSYDEGYASEEIYSESTSDNSDSSVIYADEAEIKQQDVSGSSIQREMLVYSCSMNVDVLDFDSATEKFKEKMNQYQGFIESEQYSDGSSSGRWYDEDEQKWHTYTATVRVPSRVYDDFCDAIADLGDLRSKNASVENVSQEYHDLSTTLEIYEKKEDRYLEMLANAKDEVNAVAIEDKLTDIQVEIAKFKTRMNEIKTDVAYSYVYVTVNEVREYQAAPVKKDTFGQRLLNTVSDAAAGFLDFLEGLLFFIIYALPYLVLFGLGLFILIKAGKAIKKKSAAKKEKKKEAKNKGSEKSEEKKNEEPKNEETKSTAEDEVNKK